MNKKLLISLLLGLSILGSVFAQETEPAWRIYPSLGIDMGGAIPFPFSYIPDGAKGTPNLKPNIGLGAQYKILDRWNIGLDINYHILSFTANANVISQPYWADDKSYVLYFSGETFTDVELRFVEFPLTAYYAIGETRNWSLVFGGYYSAILEGRFETEGKNGISSPDKNITDNPNLPGPVNTNYEFNDYLDNFDAGLLLGYQYKIASRVLFWGRLHVSFKSIFVPEFENIEYEMYQMRLSTGFSYALFQGKQ